MASSGLDIQTLLPANIRGSMLDATLIEPDRLDVPAATASGVQLLYYLETTDQTNTTVSAKARLVRDLDQWSNPISLSSNRTWPGFFDTGDYYKGAFFIGGGGATCNLQLLPFCVEDPAPV